MNNLLEQLKQARQAERDALELVQKREEELKNTLEYDLLCDAKEHLENMRRIIIETDKQIREQAIFEYNLTGDKHPHDKVSIVINRNLIYQEAEVFDWVGKNAPTMLKLDTKKFEKHARAVLETMPLSFVTVKEEASVRIASEL